MSRIESLTVEALRQGESYTNDKLTVRVALDDGDDPWTVEANTRDKAVMAIEEHWRRRATREAAEEQARRVERLEKRDERAKRMMAAHEADAIAIEGPCPNCTERFGLGCSGCPAKAMRTEPEGDNSDIPF